MFYLKAFWKSFLEKPLVYVYILLTLVLSVIGMGYFRILADFGNGKAYVNGNNETIYQYNIEIDNLKKTSRHVVNGILHKQGSNYNAVYNLKVEGGEDFPIFLEIGGRHDTIDSWEIERCQNVIHVNINDVAFLENYFHQEIEVGSEIEIEGVKLKVARMSDVGPTQVPYSCDLPYDEAYVRWEQDEKLNVFQKMYYMATCHGAFETDGASVAYNAIAIVFTIMCALNIGFLFSHLLQSNMRRYTIYQTVGASHKQIALASFFDGIVVAMVGFFVGYALSFGVIPLFTKSFVNGSFKILLTQLDYMDIFLFNIVFVVVAYLVTLAKSRKRVLSTSGGGIND
ncbi:MAG: ABC transporter permease [Clostridia bacterium]